MARLAVLFGIAALLASVLVGKELLLSGIAANGWTWVLIMLPALTVMLFLLQLPIYWVFLALEAVLGRTGWAFAATIALFAVFLIWAAPWAWDFWPIDACLDKGGRWNYEVRVCEYE